MDAGTAIDPVAMLRPRRTITGMSAVLLPFTSAGEIDWPGFRGHLARTLDAGLVPAVNMDTGYVNILSPQQRDEVLERTRHELAGAPFVAGAFVADNHGAAFDLDGTARAMQAIAEAGGTPVLFPSFGLCGLHPAELIEAFAAIGARADRFIGFELSPVFNPAGTLWDLDVYRALLGVKQCVGAKHSSLDRVMEWQRLRLRDEHRPDFMVLTGNDLAIDMVMYGSDYLLGLSTFCPDLFAARDAAWRDGDASFYERNDGLQHLGAIAFRAPVPAYRHDAAIFLRLRGWLESDVTPPGAARRPAWERDLLVDIASRLGVL